MARLGKSQDKQKFELIYLMPQCTQEIDHALIVILCCVDSFSDIAAFRHWYLYLFGWGKNAYTIGK